MVKQNSIFKKESGKQSGRFDVATADGGVGILDTRLTKRTADVVIGTALGAVAGILAADLLNVDFLRRVKAKTSISDEDLAKLRAAFDNAEKRAALNEGIISSLRSELEAIEREDGVHQSHVDAVNSILAGTRQELETALEALATAKAQVGDNETLRAEILQLQTTLTDKTALVERLQSELSRVTPDDGVTQSDVDARERAILSSLGEEFARAGAPKPETLSDVIEALRATFAKLKSDSTPSNSFVAALREWNSNGELGLHNKANANDLWRRIREFHVGNPATRGSFADRGIRLIVEDYFSEPAAPSETDLKSADNLEHIKIVISNESVQVLNNKGGEVSDAILYAWSKLAKDVTVSFSENDVVRQGTELGHDMDYKRKGFSQMPSFWGGADAITYRTYIYRVLTFLRGDWNGNKDVVRATQVFNLLSFLVANSGFYSDFHRPKGAAFIGLMTKCGTLTLGW